MIEDSSPRAQRGGYFFCAEAEVSGKNFPAARGPVPELKLNLNLTSASGHAAAMQSARVEVKVVKIFQLSGSGNLILICNKQNSGDEQQQNFYHLTKLSLDAPGCSA